MQLSSTSTSLTHRSQTLPGSLPVANQSDIIIKSIPDSKKKPSLSNLLAGFKIFARDRILAHPPISGRSMSLHTASGLEFDPSDFHWARIKHVLASALEMSTRGNYGTGIRHFLDFCDEEKIPPEHRHPISQDLLLAFVVKLSDTCRANTISTYVSSLVTWYQTWNQVLVRGDGVNLAIKDIAKNGPPPLPLLPPGFPDDLDAIFAGLDVATVPLHAAVWACATLSWWSMCRLGETTIASNPARADRHVMRCHLRGTAMSGAGFAVARIWLPWTKTTKTKGLDKFIVDCGDHTNAVFALRHHLFLSPHSLALASSTPLFAYKASPTSSILTPLTKQVFLAVIDRAL
ncbi:hypothetical protein CF336_g8529, partial [Tilletia laevis]